MNGTAPMSAKKRKWHTSCLSAGPRQCHRFDSQAVVGVFTEKITKWGPQFYSVSENLVFWETIVFLKNIVSIFKILYIFFKK